MDRIRGSFERPIAARAIPADQDVAESSPAATQAGHHLHVNDDTDVSAATIRDAELPPEPDSDSMNGHSAILPAELLSSQLLTPDGDSPAGIVSARDGNAEAAGRGGVFTDSRPVDRIAQNSESGLGRSTFGAANRSVDSVLGNASPNLRNRMNSSVGAGEDPEFKYPDIHVNPAQRYHELYGVDEEHDPFLLPWMVNLIYEDRWLLAERDPAKALKNQLERRTKIDIRDPDPDLANFPNGAYTVPKGRLYIENSPLGLYASSPDGNQPRIYQWEYLIRYGLTDNLEFRVFSNGLSDQAAHGNKPGFVGYQPLALDFKANFWEENTKYHVPAMGVEIYLQTKFLGSAAFDSGTQPSINLLFDQSLPFDIGFEYNFGYTGVQNNAGQIAYQFSYQWSLQREVVKDFDVFIHGFYNAAALPRLSQFQAATTAAIPNVTVVGWGGIWTVNNRLAMFGSYNFGVTPDAPSTFALLGFALAM